MKYRWLDVDKCFEIIVTIVSVKQDRVEQENVMRATVDRKLPSLFIEITIQML